MGRRALQVQSSTAILDRQSAVIQSIRDGMSSADYARIDNSLSGNTRQAELSTISGVSKRHLQKVLMGAGASFEVMCRIADAAGVTLDELRLYVHSNSNSR